MSKYAQLILAVMTTLAGDRGGASLQDWLNIPCKCHQVMTRFDSGSSSRCARSVATLLVGCASGSLLLALLASRSVLQATQELGLLSEEIFRGTRLPTLHQAIYPLDGSSTAVDDSE